MLFMVPVQVTTTACPATASTPYQVPLLFACLLFSSALRAARALRRVGSGVTHRFQLTPMALLGALVFLPHTAGKAASGAALSAEGKFGNGVALTSSSSNVRTCPTGAVCVCRVVMVCVMA